MLEEELYEPMRMWLEQYMIDNYKGCNRCKLAYWYCEVHYVRLGRIIRQWADNR